MAEHREAIKNSGPREPFTPSTDPTPRRDQASTPLTPPSSLLSVQDFNAHRDSMRKSSTSGLGRIKDILSEVLNQKKEVEAALKQATENLIACELEKSKLEVSLAAEKAKLGGGQEDGDSAGALRAMKEQLDEDLKNLDSKVEEMKQEHGAEIQKMEEKISESAEVSEALQNRVDELKGSLAQKGAEAESLSRELAQHQRRVEELTQKLTTCEEELAEKNDTLVFSEASAEHTEKQLEAVKKQHEAAEKRHEAAEKQQEASEKQHEASEKQHEAVIAGLQTKISQGEEAHGALQRELETYKQRMVEVTQQLTASDETNASYGEMMQYLQATVADMQNQVRASRELAHHEALEATTEAPAATAQANIEKDSIIRGMQAEIDDLKNQLNRNTNTISQVEKELEAATAAGQRKDTENAKLEEELQKATAEIARLDKDLQAVGGGKSIRTIIGNHTIAYNEKCREYDTLEQQLNDVRSQLRVATQERDQFKAEADNKEKSNQKVYNMFLNEQDRSTKLEKKVKKLERERDEDLTVPPDFDPDAADAQYVRNDSQGAEVQHEVDEPGVSTRNSSTRSTIHVVPKPATAQKTSTATSISKTGNKRKANTLEAGEPDARTTAQKTSTSNSTNKAGIKSKANTSGDGESDAKTTAQRTSAATSTNKVGNKRKANALEEGEPDVNIHKLRAVKKAKGPIRTRSARGL
ncbi:uncharacterized protein BDZ99DRAFT_565198 [Mytilinidion resinicola]|uniref:Uncharacterized protein n=1 Tax=Mytilinidion resinicola TaxID=574789 RepID=A0A6A6Z9G9_9PEZI|nr:uncharacterized protein BDZ99DRAFT_565198 [Mytilinidion resinicola]KAF2817448.1 hypothetical protein BDZ99DRAFT_565198 [Mytilinidion resinicola]